MIAQAPDDYLVFDAQLYVSERDQFALLRHSQDEASALYP